MFVSEIVDSVYALYIATTIGFGGLQTIINVQKKRSIKRARY